MSNVQQIAESFAEQLRGQCQVSLSDLLAENGFENTPDEAAITEAVDDLVFECEECNWWCERSEESTEQPGTCDDCAPEDDE